MYRRPSPKLMLYNLILERAKGFESSTPTLAGWLYDCTSFQRGRRLCDNRKCRWLQAPDLNQRLQTNQSHVLLDPVGGSELVGTGGVLRSLVSQASEAVTDLVGLPRPRSTAGPQVVQGLKTEIVYRCLRSYTVVHACILDKYWTERRQATLKSLKMLASRRGFEPLLAP